MADSKETPGEGFESWKERANAAFAAHKFILAVELYTRALDATPAPPDPARAVLLSNRAFAHIKLENYGSALADAEAAQRADPNYIKTYYRRGSAYVGLGKYKDAAAAFRIVLKLKPGDGDASGKLAECEKLVRKEALTEAISTPPSKPIHLEVEEMLATMAAPVAGADDAPPYVRSGADMKAGVDELFVDRLMAHFKAQKLMNRRDVYALLLDARKVLAAQPSVVDVTVPEDAASSMVVCGDVHGQFYDLLNIFKLAGRPSAQQQMLFNGDYVDRGSFSCEVILTLLALKVLHPQSLHLTRGNHETKNMNKMYGFEGEVRAKYGEKAMELFADVFQCLPLAALVNKKVFIVHGGLFSRDDVTINDLRAINRFREPPESGLMSEMLWSDPQPAPGRLPSKRGVGSSFGPDVTARFLERNSLSLVIRSHEVKDEGYAWEHGRSLMTVFSAPNYCDQMGNKGAFVRLRAPALVPDITSFAAVEHPAVKPMAYASNFSFLGM